MMRLFFISITLFMLASCGSEAEEQRPAGILSEAKFVEVYTDIKIMEATFKQKIQRVDDAKEKIFEGYVAVFEKYNVSEEEFKATYTYYYENEDRMLVVLEKVNERLALMLQEMERKGED